MSNWHARVLQRLQKSDRPAVRQMLGSPMQAHLHESNRCGFLLGEQFFSSEAFSELDPALQAFVYHAHLNDHHDPHSEHNGMFTCWFMHSDFQDNLPVVHEPLIDFEFSNKISTMPLLPISAEEAGILESTSEQEKSWVSAELGRMWLDGMGSIIEPQNYFSDTPLYSLMGMAGPDLGDICFQIGRQVDKLIVQLANVESFGVEGSSITRIPLSHDGRLIDLLESLIVDQLIVPPRKAVPFLNILANDLKTRVQSGQRLQGSWGELVINALGNLEIVVKRAEKRSFSEVFGDV